MTSTLKIRRPAAFALLLMALVAACAAPVEETIGQCEPGVTDLSGTPSVAPACP